MNANEADFWGLTLDFAIPRYVPDTTMVALALMHEIPSALLESRRNGMPLRLHPENDDLASIVRTFGRR